MAETSTNPVSPSDVEQMHTRYRQGGGDRQMAPHVVYADEECPHSNCHQRLQAIDFRLEAFGPDTHDPLVRAWWDDQGFAGQCPLCGGWIHFTIRNKHAISSSEATELPNLPANWFDEATIL